MKRNELFLEITKTTHDMINSYEYLCNVRTEPRYFTRKGKLGFKNTILLMLNFLKKTLTIELDNYFEKVLGTTLRITKQAFSTGRQKISYKAFTIMIEEQIKKVYTATDLNTYRGYRLTAVDGSTMEIENTQELRNKFGYAKNKISQVARARVSGLYDVENNIMIDAIIEKYDISEKELAKMHIEKLIKIGLKNDLILFDRGYPSKELMAFLIDNNINFVMRVSSSFLKEVNGANSGDEEIIFTYNGNKYNIRVVKCELDSGEDEKLLTTLLDKDFTTFDFKTLYFKRWGVEVKYDELKNRLEVENLSGKTPIAIKQDFYASIYLQNMVSLAKMQSDEEIQENNEEKFLKYKYQTNVNILVGKLKYKMILMLMTENVRKRAKLYKEVMFDVVKNIVPIRPERHNERKFKVTRNRYPMNARRSL